MAPSGHKPPLSGRLARSTTESSRPSEYRLALKDTGQLILQGGFDVETWEDGRIIEAAIEWRDVPTVQLDSAGNVKS